MKRGRPWRCTCSAAASAGSSAGRPRIGSARGRSSRCRSSLSCPFLVAAPFLTGAPFVVVLALGGLFLQSTLPVNVTFGQALAPVSAATVSSLMMGFAWGTGGLSVPIVGLIADRVGIEPTLVGLALIPLLAAACALPLPDRSPRPSAPQPADVVIPDIRS